MMTRPAFESSLAALRDNVVMAIERREMGVVQDGLDVYLRLIETILDEQLGLQAATKSESGPNLPLGREWEQILRDLHGVIDSTNASSSRLLWVDILSWVRRVANACVDRGVLNALGDMLTLFESAWSQELASPSKDSSARQDALLLRLSAFGRFYLNPAHSGDGNNRGAHVIYTRTFLRVIKQAIESDDPEAAKVAIEYFLHGRTSARQGLDPVTGAGLLALYAWILYRLDHGEQDESFEELSGQIASALQRGGSLVTILRGSDDLERELGINWWELRDRGPMSSGAIQIGSYMSLALILIAGPRQTLRKLDPADEETVDHARRLMTIIDSIEKGGFARALAALGVATGHFEPLKSHLSRVVEQGDAILEESYARLPVDPARVEKFRTAVRNRLWEMRSGALMAALISPPTTQTESIEPNFGVNTLISRSYFAHTRVIADPEELAESLVRALVSGEEDQILDVALGDLAGSSETSLDSLVADLAASIASGSRTTAVVVTNSYQAHQVLSGTSWDNADAASKPFTAGEVVRVHDDRSPYVALLSPAGAPTVRLSLPATEVDGDKLESNLAVLVGVSEVPRDEMNDILGREERSRIDEARLRGSLRVRLMEHLEVELEDESGLAVWRLPETAW